MRNLKSAVAGFMAGHFARAERGVRRHHVQPGVVRSTVGSQIEDSDMVACGSEVDFALIATPEDTVTKIGLLVGWASPFRFNEF